MTLCFISAGRGENINAAPGLSDEENVMQVLEPIRAGAVPVLAGGFANILGQERASTLEDERQEVVTSVLTALAGGPWDPDQMAACGYLLKHLADAVGRDAPPRA